MHTDTFIKIFHEALEKPPVLPAYVPAEIFLGRLYHITEETENAFLTILSGGVVEAGELYSFTLRPMPCGMLLYTQSGGGVLRIGRKDYPLAPQSLLYLNCSALSSHWKLETADPVWKYNVFFMEGEPLDAYDRLNPPHMNRC